MEETFKALAEALMADAISDSTKRSYDEAYKKWEKFTEEYGFEALPARAKHVVWYLAFLSVNDASYEAAKTAVAAISDRHVRGFAEDPCSHASVKRALCGFKRRTATAGTKQVRPLT